MKKWRIMVVDDEEDTRRLLSLTLSPHYEVVEASDGLEALTKLETYEPDFIILDIMMPLLDGYGTCEAIRQKPSYKDVPIIFLSSKDAREDIKKGYESGANLFLTKPIEPQRLLRNIELFIETNPPPVRAKTFTLERVKEREKLLAEPAPSGEETGPAKEAQVQRDAFPQPLIRVLVIDDDPDIHSFVSLALKSEYEVFSAADGMAAITKMAEYEPDILLLDIMMPKLSGYQLCQSVRRNPKLRHIPIIIISGKGSPKDIKYARQVGADDYLVKPFEADALLAALEKVVQRPDFSKRPKRLSGAEIQKKEEREKEKTSVPLVEAEEKKFLKKEEQELRRFINKHMRNKKPSE